MINGGYKIINLKDKNLVDKTTATIDGIYTEIESNYRKAILLSGITLDGVEKRDVFVEVNTSNANYVIVVYGYTLTITNENKVTATKN